MTQQAPLWWQAPEDEVLACDSTLGDAFTNDGGHDFVPPTATHSLWWRYHDQEWRALPVCYSHAKAVFEQLWLSEVWEWAIKTDTTSEELRAAYALALEDAEA